MYIPEIKIELDKHRIDDCSLGVHCTVNDIMIRMKLEDLCL